MLQATILEIFAELCHKNAYLFILNTATATYHNFYPIQQNKEMNEENFLPKYGIIYYGKNNEYRIQSRQGNEEVVKWVVHVWFWQNNDTEDVSNQANNTWNK